MGTFVSLCYFPGKCDLQPNSISPCLPDWAILKSSQAIPRQLLQDPNEMPLKLNLWTIFFLLERIVISLADYYMCCLCPWVGSWRWSCCFLLRLAISQSTSASKPVTGVHGFAARSGPLFLPLDLFSYRTLFEFILVCLNWWFSSYLSSAFVLTWFFAFILT